MSSASHTHGFRVALHDTDAAGVLFYAHLFRHAHDAYEAFMASIGWSLDAMIRGRELALPLVHAEADYRRPMRHGDQVQVAVTVADLARARFTIRYCFTAPGEELLASARTIHAAIHPDGGRPTPLPPGLAAALRASREPAG
jgi:1,4-dihydroxy-2-naphthoyl-CoA hydrolase